MKLLTFRLGGQVVAAHQLFPGTKYPAKIPKFGRKRKIVAPQSCV